MSELEFFSEQLPFKSPTFEITTKPASASLNFKTLIAGIEQPITLTVSGGSFIFPADAKITLKCSKNLRIRLAQNKENQENQENPPNYDDDSSFESVLNVALPNFKSFEEREIALEVLTDLPGRKVNKHFEHHISLACPWSRNELQIPIEFQPAMEATCRLNTCGNQKFLQVIVKGLDANLYLTEAKVKCDVPGVRLIDLNPASQNCIVCILFFYKIYTRIFYKFLHNFRKFTNP